MLTLMQTATEAAVLSRIIISGNKYFRSRHIKSQMNSQAEGVIAGLIPGKKGEVSVFSRSEFEEDVQRIRRLYWREGFAAVAVTYSLDSLKSGRKVRAQIRIEEGIRSIIKEIRLTMTGGVGDSLKHEFEVFLMGKGGLMQPGQPFRDEDILNAENKLIEKAGESGYPLIELQRRIYASGLDTVTVEFILNMGIECHFSQAIIEGDSLVKRDFIEGKLHFREGEKYSSLRMEKMREELYESGLFRYVGMRVEVDSPDSLGGIPLKISLMEEERWNLETGVGFGSEDLLRFSLLFSGINLGDERRSIRLRQAHSFIVPVDLDLKLIQVDWGREDRDVILNPYYLREIEESYNVRRLGLALHLKRAYTQYVSTLLSGSFGNVNVNMNEGFEAVSTDAGRMKGQGSYSINYRKLDHRLSPKRGYAATATLSFGGILSDHSKRSMKMEFEQRAYRDISESVVLAGKIHGGQIVMLAPGGISAIEDRLFAGGGNSLRAWKRNEIAPRDSLGNVIGGNTLLEFSGEWRQHLGGIYSLVIFVDAGNVWAEAGQVEMTDLLTDAGLGLRMNSAAGPLRLDIAYPLIRRSVQGWQLFISLGQAF